jgi:hypothetical protein
MILSALQGLELLSRRKFSTLEGKRFISQMVQYKASEQPYDASCGGPEFRVKDWWLMLKTPDTAEICDVATILCDMVPHAAVCERAFSMLNEFDRGEHPSVL